MRLRARATKCETTRQRDDADDDEAAIGFFLSFSPSLDFH